jgi:alkanesulfonate monooxygenase SsuD/methylene tetrahydromethanopterin reductase-like flavin-dependent oxidoreductase (luciferase family)
MNYIEQMREELEDVREYFKAAGAENDFKMRVGLKAIAHEEFTHARYLRANMIRMGIYDPAAHPMEEALYLETERMFED